MAEIKYYAAQVAPEDQDPNFDRCNWWGWTVTGNRNYEGFTTAEYNKLFGTTLCGGCLCARTSAFPIAVEEYAQPSDASITQFLKSWFDPVDRSDGIIVASTPKPSITGKEGQSSVKTCGLMLGLRKSWSEESLCTRWAIRL